jgi:hypothetical protein
MVLLGYSGARGTLIYEKNLMSKISRQTPFNSLASVLCTNTLTRTCSKGKKVQSNLL